MERATAIGLDQVAGLLRRLADGIETGEIRLGDDSFAVTDDLVAVVDAPRPPADSMLIALRLEWPHARPAHLAVEHELIHPGG